MLKIIYLMQNTYFKTKVTLELINSPFVPLCGQFDVRPALGWQALALNVILPTELSLIIIQRVYKLPFLKLFIIYGALISLCVNRIKSTQMIPILMRYLSLNNVGCQKMYRLSLRTTVLSITYFKMEKRFRILQSEK